MLTPDSVLLAAGTSVRLEIEVERSPSGMWRFAREHGPTYRDTIPFRVIGATARGRHASASTQITAAGRLDVWQYRADQTTLDNGAVVAIDTHRKWPERK